jgi:hypothetical protein
VPGMWGGVLAPLGLFWLAFTTYKSVNSAVPIVASVPFGIGVFFIFTSAWTVRFESGSSAGGADARCVAVSCHPLSAVGSVDHGGQQLHAEVTHGGLLYASAGAHAIRSCFAAGFPLFAGQMYETLGTVGATALLAGLCALMAPLP